MAKRNNGNNFNFKPLTEEEKLRLYYLSVKDYWYNKFHGENDLDRVTQSVEKQLETISDWKMLKAIKLHDWQIDCRDRWMKHKKGTIKVVTGAGKTILALGIIEELHKQVPDLRVIIIVPTIVLQSQWYDEITRLSNLPESCIGRLGGGFSDKINDSTYILISVINSAAEKLEQHISTDKRIFLIVDECHRAGASEMSRIFNIKRDYNLGLSATPERDDPSEEGNDNENLSYEDSLLGKELGPIIYEMSIKKAFEKGILPKFEIIHVGMPLNNVERHKYDKLTKEIREIEKEIKYHPGNKKMGRPSYNLLQSWTKRDDELGKLCRNYVFRMQDRKMLLYGSEIRLEVVRKILRDIEKLNVSESKRAMLFHESINHVMNIFFILSEGSYKITVDNSMLPSNKREEAISLYRDGIAQVIISPRTLIEGFNVPETDIGIIIASSSSVRQRIQTMGRILRKTKNKGEAVSRIYVLYIKDTVDESIYGKTDWENLIGAEINIYKEYTPEKTFIDKKGPPRSSLPRESEIDSGELTQGEEYPGEYKGKEYSCDTNGNIRNSEGKIALDSLGIPNALFKIKKSYGRFRITPIKKIVLAPCQVGDDWTIAFIMQLKDDLVFDSQQSSDKDFTWIGLETGDEVPRTVIDKFAKEPLSLSFKQKSGRIVITKKEKRSELFARDSSRADNKDKGKSADLLLENYRMLRSRGIVINKFDIYNNKYAVFVKDGIYRFLAIIEAELEFPERIERS